GSYDLKLYYTDTGGHEVVVEWRRITVASTTLPATVVQTDSTDPFDFAGQAGPPAAPSPITTSTQGYTGNSLVVLASESNASLVKSGANVTVTAGAYAGPLDAAASPFSLVIGTTTGTA